MNDPKKLINWAELSRSLAGDRSAITKNRIPKIHKEKINDLINKMKDWQDKLPKN